MSDLEKDKAFKAPSGENALSKRFDHFNGDYDTPEEFIRACLQNEPRALELLKQQKLEGLEAALETMTPEIRQRMEALLQDIQAGMDPKKEMPSSS